MGLKKSKVLDKNDAFVKFKTQNYEIAPNALARNF